MAAGLTWRARNGRMRRPRQVPAARGRDARAVTMDEPSAGSAAGSSGQDAGGLVTAAQIGRPLGERATLLQFSSAFCAPCRATRRILADVAGMTSGVAGASSPGAEAGAEAGGAAGGAVSTAAPMAAMTSALRG